MEIAMHRESAHRENLGHSIFLNPYGAYLQANDAARYRSGALWEADALANERFDLLERSRRSVRPEGSIRLRLPGRGLLTGMTTVALVSLGLMLTYPF
jgi:hypothetical protein